MITRQVPTKTNYVFFEKFRGNPSFDPSCLNPNNPYLVSAIKEQFLAVRRSRKVYSGTYQSKFSFVFASEFLMVCRGGSRIFVGGGANLPARGGGVKIQFC